MSLVFWRVLIFSLKNASIIYLHSLSELKKIDIDLDKGFCLGIFRADFTGENENSVIWYSWLNPHTKDPDFHIPSAFGKCKMKQP